MQFNDYECSYTRITLVMRVEPLRAKQEVF